MSKQYEKKDGSESSPTKRLGISGMTPNPKEPKQASVFKEVAPVQVLEKPKEAESLHTEVDSAGTLDEVVEVVEVVSDIQNSDS